MSPKSGEKNFGLEDGTPSSFRDQLASLARVFPFVWPKGNINYRLRVIGSMIVIFLGSWISVYAPFVLRDVSNRLETNDVVTITLVNAGLFMLGYGFLRLMSVVIPQIREFLFTRVGQNAQREIALMVFQHMHMLSLRFHLERRTGGITRLIDRGVKSIDFLFRFLLFNIGPMLITLGLICVAFIQQYEWQFALIAVATVAVYFWVTVSSTEWRLKFRRDMNQQDQDAATKAVDSLLNYETVKYFNNEKFEADRYDHSMRAYQEAAIRSNNSLAVVNIGQSLVYNAGFVALLILTAQGILQERFQVGDLMAVSLIMMNLQQPLNILGFAYREIKQSLVDMEKMFAMLNIPPEVEDRPDAKDIEVKGGAIVFDAVRFAYQTERQILKGVSFTANPGEKIAIVGPSGAGKSTISRILYRFYDIESGAVLIDGQDIREVTQDSLRRVIGMVPQDTVLFNDTIAYNIGYAKPGATQNEIEAAAKMAQIHEFIIKLPDGYNSMVGERGLKLSGGEKQRVAIARTILKNPPILILDEATSALDSVTESEIQTALREVSANRTTLVIAHRLSTIIDANRIIVLRDGEIVEQGTHATLLASGGDYASLWNQQQDSELETA